MAISAGVNPFPSLDELGRDLLAVSGWRRALSLAAPFLLGGLVSCGLIVLLVVWKAPLDKPLWQALLISGTMGFACAVGVHFSIGYLNLIHVGPAIGGFLVFVAGMLMTKPAAHS